MINLHQKYKFKFQNLIKNSLDNHKIVNSILIDLILNKFIQFVEFPVAIWGINILIKYFKEYQKCCK